MGKAGHIFKETQLTDRVHSPILLAENLERRLPFTQLTPKLWQDLGKREVRGRVSEARS